MDTAGDEEAARLLEMIGPKVTDADTLARQTGLPVREINSRLMMLVMEGKLRQVDGCRYIRP